MSSSTATLAAASQDRKTRLAQLRSLKRKQPDETNNHVVVDGANTDQAEAQADTTEDDDVIAKYLSGRNFDLSTGGAKLGFEHAPDENKETVERKAESLAERVLSEAKDSETKDEPLDLFKLQPKKPNWDLKRDLKQRMEILDVRTDNAIARMVRERIAKQKKAAEGGGGGDVEAGSLLEGADLVEAVHVREREELEEQRREKEWEAGLADADV